VGISFPLTLLACLPLVPETPRWLFEHHRDHDAVEVLKRMHKNPHDPKHLYALDEAAQIRGQAEMDRSLDGSWGAIFAKRSYRWRALLIILVATAGQCTGIQAVTNFGPSLYAAMGYDSEDQLLLAAGWITVAAFEPYVMMLIMDRVGRKPLLVGASAISVVTLGILAALTKYYGTSDNQSGKQAAVAFLYLFIVGYLLCEAPGYVYMGEVFPTHLRSKGAAIGIMTINLNATWITYATPTGIAKLGWKYYMVFMTISGVCAIVMQFTIPETKQVPLEEIALIFGDTDEVGTRKEESSNLPVQGNVSPAGGVLVGDEKIT
ncbi:general substrate transporter, partial [Calocera viscosa TUFC12733]